MAGREQRRNAVGEREWDSKDVGYGDCAKDVLKWGDRGKDGVCGGDR
jgi:hypothetical protein